MTVRYVRKRIKPKIALLTTFYDITGFSVTTVATNQIRQLLDHGYLPRVIVQEGMPARRADGGPDALFPFKEIPETDPGPYNVWNSHKIDLRPILPALHLRDFAGDDFEERVGRIENALYNNLKDMNVVITHDIMLLDTYHEHNVAVRRVAHRCPNILWLHWLHSCPRQTTNLVYPEMCRGVLAPGYLIYPNYTDLGYVQRTYRLAGQHWRAKQCKASHGIDLLNVWGFRPETKKIAKESDILNADVSIVYPARMGESKQFHKIIFMLAGIKECGYTGRLIGIDWQSLGDEFIQYKDYCLDLAERLGVRDWVYFSSEIGNEMAAGVDRRVVLELFYLSNVFLHPSMIETFGMVPEEASAIGGCLLGLNFDLRPHLEIFGDMGLYFDFGSLEKKRKWKEEEGEAQFYMGEARTLIAELTHGCRALWARTQMRKKMSLDTMWPEFEPLLYLEPQPGHPGPWWPNETTKEPAPNAQA